MDSHIIPTHYTTIGFYTASETIYNTYNMYNMANNIVHELPKREVLTFGLEFTLFR